MDKKKVLAIIVFIFFGFFMFAFANPKEDTMEKVNNNETTTVSTNNNNNNNTNNNNNNTNSVTTTTTTTTTVATLNNNEVVTTTAAPKVLVNATLSIENFVDSMEVGSVIPKFSATVGEGDTLFITNDIDANTVGSYKVIFTSTSVDGLIVTEEKDFYVVDTIAPVIKMNGKDETIRKNSTYNDLGAVATDNYDKDINSKLVIDNKVDNTTKGTYTVTYNVTDSSNNAAKEVVRNVTVTDADELVKAINDGNDLINKIPSDVDLSITKLVDELKDEIKKGNDEVKDETTPQSDIDDTTKKINDLIDEILNTKFTVKFVDYNDTLLYQEKVKFMESATAPETPNNKVGHKFKKWDKDYSVITKPLTVKAEYEILTNIKYVVNIYKDNVLEKTINDLTGTYNTTVSYNPESIKGYSVDKKSNLSGKIDGVSTLTLNVYYTSNIYTLKIYENNKNVIYEKGYRYNENVGNINITNRNGYTYELSESIPTTMPDKDVTIKVTYKLNTYKLTYTLAKDEKINGNTTKNFTVVTDTFKLKTPTKQGYEFVEWVDQDGNSISEVVKGTYKNITVKAVFKESNSVVYKKVVKVEKLDGTYTETSNKLTGTTNAPVSIEKVEKTGYYIDETNSTLTGTIKADGSTVLTIIYRLRGYKLTFKVDGVVVEEKTNVLYGSKIVAPKVTLDESELFSGFNIDETMPAKDTVYEGHKTKKTFTVKFLSEGKVISTQTVEYGSSAVAPTEPTKDKYTFAGWDKAFTNVKSNLEVNAKFNPNIIRLDVYEKPNAHFEYTKGKAYNVKDEIDYVEFVYADNTTKKVDSYTTDFSTATVGTHTLTIAATKDGKTYYNKDITYKVIEVVTFQTKFEVKFTDQYKNKCSMFSKDCNYLTIIEHYDELIEVESVKASYQNQNGIVKLDLTDMVNHSSYGYDEAYNDYVYRDPEYLAAHDINFFGALTGKVMDKNNGYVINQVFVTYKMKKPGDKNYGVSKTITFNYNASNNTFKAISER